jgi:hypothetical protein
MLVRERLEELSNKIAIGALILVKAALGLGGTKTRPQISAEGWQICNEGYDSRYHQHCKPHLKATK